MKKRTGPPSTTRDSKKRKVSKTRSMEPDEAGAGSAGQQQQVPTCPLLQSGVLSVLLHHPCITNSTSIICRLMCCSAELKTIIATHCIGLVHVTLSDLPIPIDWMRQHAHLLRCLELKFRLLKLEELVKAERGLVHVLKYSTSSLKLSSFVSECDQVSVPMLKRLPVSSLTRLCFTDNPQARHDQHLAQQKLLKAATSKKKEKDNKTVQKPGGLAELSQACRSLSNLRELEVTTNRGFADFLLPQVAFLKHLTRLQLDAVQAPNRSLSTHLPKGLKVLQLTHSTKVNKATPRHKLDLSKCKVLSQLELINGPLCRDDILPRSLTALSAASCSSLQPLLPLKHLAALTLTSSSSSGAGGEAAASPAAAAAVPYEGLRLLSQLTCLVLGGVCGVLPPEALLPPNLLQLDLGALRDSVKQLEGLTRLTSLEVSTLEVPPSGHAPLTALTALQHISWGLQLPQDALSAAAMAEALGAEGELSTGASSLTQANLEECLAQWGSWDLPVAELCLRGAVLNPTVLGSIGKLKQLSKLKLQGCSGRIEGTWPRELPYRCLTDHIRSWTQLQSLAFKGFVWKLATPPPPTTATPDFTWLEQAEAAALSEPRDMLNGMSILQVVSGDAAATQEQLAMAQTAMATAKSSVDAARAAVTQEHSEQKRSDTAAEHKALKEFIQRDERHGSSIWYDTLTEAVGRLTQLTGLDLSGWSLSESVTKLRPLTRLRSLSLEDANQTDSSLLRLLPVLGQLTSLSVAGNRRLTMAPLVILEDLLPELQVLNVKHCHGVGKAKESMDWLVKQQGRLEVTPP